MDKLANGKILWGDVGVGKTITALAYWWTKVCGGVLNDLGSMRTPTDLIVITTAKKRDEGDWQMDAAKFGVSDMREMSTDGVGFTVDSWNNIGRYLDVEGAFFIFDEQRLVGSGAWTQHFIQIAKHNKWILLSATPGDVWLDYIPVFVANGWYKNRTAFKREHVVYSSWSKFPKVERYVGLNKLTKYKNRILVEMPFERHTVREEIILPCEYDRVLFEKVVKQRWHVYEERPLRDVSELFSVMRKVVNSDASRLTAVRGLLKSHPKLIVFYNFDYELEALRSLALNVRASTTSSSTNSSSGQQTTKNDASERCLLSNSHDSGESWAVAEWNGHKHEPIPTSERWVYLVQYVAGSEGWNCVETDAMVLYSQTYSYKNHYQAFGRIDRMNTRFQTLKYYRLVSDSMIDKAIGRSLKEKKNFNERSLAQKLGD